MRQDELAVLLATDLREQVDALCAATDAARATARLARLESEAALAEVAQRARISEIRFAAAQRISDPDLLARIVEVTRRRDNRVYRHCSDLLRARCRTLGHAMRAAELAAAFRRILATKSDLEAFPADSFEELDSELNSLLRESSVPQECLDLAAAVRERVQRDAQAMRDLGADAAEAEALCVRIESAAGPADAEALRGNVEAIVERSSQRVAWLAGHPTAAALAHSMERATAALDALAPEPKAVEPAPAAPAPREARPLRTPPAGERDAVRDLLERLALQVQAGQPAEAEDTERQLVEKAGAGPLPESLMRRLRRERAQLGRMRDWARWGDDQARGQLIRAAEELLQGEREPEKLATAVTGLREQWKQLDASRHATRKQWERFDAVLTRAFRPVLEYRAERAGQEKAAAAAKAILCDQCEAWSAGIDWEKAEIRSIAGRRHDFGNQWRALPFAGFRAERQLRKRFDKVLKAVDAHIGMARQAEFGRREALIREAEALRDAPQLGIAIKSATALQARWKDSARNVGLARQEEQALWQRFHAACNAVFAQRDEKRNARETERTAREAERSRQLNERKARDERRLDAARNRFEQRARDSVLAAAQASAVTLDKGRIEREALLLDLELALDLPSSPSASGARRARQLLKLQERFRPGKTGSADPEMLLQRWYAAARSDPEHDSRMSSIVEALVKASRQPAQ
ncbi:MAG: DUF349 domain-containing protein [Betaproteobacteria bacterium]|nr:DUF349 domain-containing protein [Betaproteobacteria bacterium]